MKRVNVSLGDELYKKVEKRSTETGASMSSILALAYEQYEMQQTVTNRLPELLEAIKKQQLIDEKDLKSAGFL